MRLVRCIYWTPIVTSLSCMPVIWIRAFGLFGTSLTTALNFFSSWQYVSREYANLYQCHRLYEL